MGWFNKLMTLFIKNKTSKDSYKGFYMSGLDFNIDSREEFNATYNNCAMALSRHISKIQVGVTNKSSDAVRFRYLDRILKFKPNPIQTSSNFYYSLAYSYFFGGIALAFIDWDTSDITQKKVKAIWPVATNLINDIKVSGENVFFKFMLDGELRLASLDDFIVLVKHPKMENPFNYKDESMKKILEILATNEEGIIKAIQNSNLIRFLVLSASKMNDKLIEENQKKIEKRIQNSNGALYIESGEQVVPLTNQSKYASAEDVADMKKEIYNYFGVSDAFLNSSYNEDSWQSVYDGAIEPFIMQLSQELTIKLFTKREFDVGNRIEVVTSPLQTASLKTRISIAEAYLKLPTIRPNVVCDLLYLPRLENGDKEVQSLNYVSANKVDSYQGVEGNDNSNQEGDNENEN